MKTSLNSLEGLKKSLTVELAIDFFISKKDNLMKKFSKEAKIDGFRKGRVPINILKKHFGDKADSDASNEIISESLAKALKNENVVPADRPVLAKIDLENKKIFSYTVEFEIFPDIEVVSFANLEIKQFKSSISETDQSQALQELQENATEFNPVKRKSKTADRLIIDFEGTINNEPFEGGAHENFEIIIGKGLMIEGFEEGITGVMADKDKEIEVKAKFPANYSVKELSKKQAVFKIKVKEVGAPKVVKIDNDLAKIYGDKDLASMKQRIFKQMQKELDDRLAQINKNEVFDAVLKANKFDIPQSTVDTEAQRLQADMQQKMAQQGSTDNKIPQEIFQEEASKRVRLGVLVNKIAKDNKIVVKKEFIESKIKDMASNYNEDYQQVLSWYKEDRQRMLSVESLVTEEMVVKLIIETAKIKTTTKDFATLMKIKN